MKSKEIGAYCEKICKNYLIDNGYNILETNYYSRYGEIDIIAINQKYLAFVEVKARKKTSLTRALEAVDKKKMIKIIKTAYQFLSEKNLDLQPRFDVCEVYFLKQNNIKVNKINYIKNAFSLDYINLDYKL